MLARPADWRFAIAYTREARLGAMGEAPRYSPHSWTHQHPIHEHVMSVTVVGPLASAVELPVQGSQDCRIFVTICDQHRFSRVGRLRY